MSSKIARALQGVRNRFEGGVEAIAFQIPRFRRAISVVDQSDLKEPMREEVTATGKETLFASRCFFNFSTPFALIVRETPYVNWHSEKPTLF